MTDKEYAYYMALKRRLINAKGKMELYCHREDTDEQYLIDLHDEIEDLKEQIRFAVADAEIN